MLNSEFGTDCVILGLAIFLFFINLFFDYYACIAGGNHKSPIVGTLLDKGYQWAFGISSGLSIVIAEVISFFLLNILFDGSFPFSFPLVIKGLFLYLFAAIGLNVWGKWFLKTKGVTVNENVGWKWFTKGSKQLIEQKNKERGLAPNPESGLKGFVIDLKASIEKEKQKQKR